MHEGIAQPEELQFGNTINSVSEWINQNNPCILIIEAVLSTYHNEAGNPDFRGEFERGRGWYYGPGVVTFAAALRFLQTLRQQVSSDASVLIAEAFLSFKKNRSSHSNDAMIIFNKFWDTHPEKLMAGTEPIADFIEGIPSVRVFHD
ncbi:hypothetical protein ACFL6B_03815 [Thermodesulfobacteriota bacterium]